MKKLVTGLLLMTGLLIVGCSIDGKDKYGERVERDKSEVFYKDDATKLQADQLMQYLYDIEWFNTTDSKSVQIFKKDGKYNLSFVVKEGLYNDDKAISILTHIGNDVCKKIFNGESLAVNLCNTKLEIENTIDIDATEAYNNISDGQNDVLHYDDVTAKMAQDLFDYLRAQAYFTAGTPNTVKIRTVEEGYEVDFLIMESYWDKDDYAMKFLSFGKQINENVFDGDLTAVNFCDLDFNVPRKIDLND